MEPLERRAGLRRTARRLRREMDQAQRARASGEICRRLLALPEYGRCTTLLGYMPLEGEVDVEPLLRHALEQGKRVFLPCSNPDGTMEFRETDLEDLETGAFGVREPRGGALFRPEAGSLCILPGLCFDWMGYRLGYGKGYYDRFLQEFHQGGGISIGVCFSACVVPDCLPQPHDRRADLLITEERTGYITG